MSLKDSMIRGLAMYGATPLAQSGHADYQMILDIINDTAKNARCASSLTRRSHTARLIT